MTYSGFKYCPFCGEELPQNHMMKFCPFCGKKSSLNDKIALEVAQHEVIKEKTLSKNVDQEQKIKNEIYMRDDTLLLQHMDNEYYSIILKYTADRMNLIKVLEKILVRSAFAVRLAVDNMPSLIIYKAKREDIVNLHIAFVKGQASVSIIPGEFNNNPSLKELFPMFGKLNIQMRKDIEGLPMKLWIGDQITNVFPIKYGESKKGILVITNKNIYIIYKYAVMTKFRWLVISYTLLLKVVKENKSLEFIYKNNKVERIEFITNRELVEAFEAIEHIV
ncbi:zinc ribbon domain-containing protein [Pelosinus baikalensis]|uniref:Zinc ribbon domain-containing protein n=1 Tax=Pelosinus baikalensis TaxID=2892015 RepID=A0ABS8HP33_9FIRM|nr:zinc ribbon domain-containing protein [Pelosinus baikalensis]MCC5464930.1 zinc ribbon domain-containing protein [Pelosinus baikalensis]